MTPAAYLLVLPDDYAAELSHLQWALGHDAVETAGGDTFALAEEVAAFLDGFASRRPLMHFAHVLHFLYLLRVGHRPRHNFSDLARAWDEAGRPARTAGAFAATLCAEVPSLASPVDPDEVRRCLEQRVPLANEAPSVVEDPPFSPDVFEALVASALLAYSYDKILHCLRHGQPGAADAPARLAGQVLSRPLSLREVLDELARHERFAGAVPLVPRLLGALALPPRRLADSQLPLGGYSDVGTRGQPEQILPTQFALDADEFLRRFAERELLFYRREEPPAPACDRLVVLLDQGVRTWGRVRLALAGCLLALAETARRRKWTLTLAVSSNGGVPLAPLTLNPADLAERAGASDLTPHPGLALERALEAQQGPRDVVLLTHPRSLDEPDVQAAARRATADVRLFAVAVAPSGEVTFSEMRRGLPVRLGRFHLDLQIPPPPATPAPEPAGEWSGPLEPVGFPFRFGPGGSHDPFLFAFDADGDRLLAVLPRGLLLLMKRDGSECELLSRVLLEGRLLTDVHGVIGVAGGFVVTAAQAGKLIAAHYDVVARVVQVYAFVPDSTQLTRGVEWRYLRRRHALALRVGDVFSGLRLATGRPEEPFPPELRWQPADPPNRFVVPLPPELNNAPGARPRLRFDPRHGEIDVDDVVLTPAWSRLTPLMDGRPALIGHTLLRADCRGGALAALFQAPQRGKILWLITWPDCLPLTTLPLPFERDAFALSADGRYVALQRGPCQVEVRETAPGGGPVGQSPVGRFHNNIVVHLGEQQLLLSIDRRVHLFSWGIGELTYLEGYGEGTRGVARAWRADQDRWSDFRATPGRLPDFLAYDRGRFRLAAWDNLIAVVTQFGEVFLFEQTGELVCGFFAFRQQAAAWMPDGTRWGAEALLGRPQTPGAAEKIGKALSEAWQRGERTV